VFENRVVRRISESNTEKVNRRLEKISKCYVLFHIIKVLKCRAGHVAGIGNVRNTYKILVGGNEVNRQLERPRYR